MVLGMDGSTFANLFDKSLLLENAKFLQAQIVDGSHWVPGLGVNLQTIGPRPSWNGAESSLLKTFRSESVWFRLIEPSFYGS